MNTAEHTEKFNAETDNRLVIDIETIPNPEAVALLPEPSIDSRLKDPEKIEAAKAEAKLKQIDKMALSPLTGKVACVGYHSSIGAGVLFDNEPELLDYAYDLIRNATVITFNGKSFDIPFIFKRGIILNRKWATIPEMKRFTDRYKSSAHIDLMLEFCNYGEFEKLDTLARFILGYGKTEFDFREIPQLIQTEEGRAKVAEYCAQDCKITWELALRMGY